MRLILAGAFSLAAASPLLPQSVDGNAARSYLAVSIGAGEGQFGAHPATRYSALAGVLTWRRVQGPGVGRSTSLTLFTADHPQFGAHAEYPCCLSSSPVDSAISGYILTQTFDWKNFGVTAGMVGGAIVVSPSRNELVANSSPRAASALRPRYPALGLRVGPLTGLYVDAGMFATDPAAMPTPIFTVGLGLGDKSGTRRFRAGFSEAGFYAGGSATLTPLYDAALSGSLYRNRSAVSLMLTRRIDDTRGAALPSFDRTGHQHPFIDRMDYFMLRGALLGAFAGPVAGLARQSTRNATGEMSANAVVGAGVGLVGGSVVGLLSRFQPPPSATRVESPTVAWFRDVSRYMGLGANLGMGAGVVYSMADPHRGFVADVDHALIVLNGMLVGMVAGVVVYLVQH